MNIEQMYLDYKDKLRVKIAELGVSEASRIIGVHKSFLHRFKNRQVNLSAEVAFRFGKKLGLLPDDGTNESTEYNAPEGQ